MSNKYIEYFDIDKKYYPCIDESAMKEGNALWNDTYPHAKFIQLLEQMERALARQNNGKTIWVDGSYGTGKSKCAYALRKILEVSESELCDYWNKFEPLKQKQDLLQKYLGHKAKGIVVASRYASGDITSPKDLFFAIQETIKAALEKQNIAYKGENTLKESIIEWLSDEDHKALFNMLLNNKNKEWRGLFAQSNVDEILNALRNGKQVESLVNNIFTLADKEGITALTINSDNLIKWIEDIIDKNNIKIVFVWDEFSDYFKQNKDSLSEFQKIVSLVQSKPFYFIAVTHDTQQMYIVEGDKNSQIKVSDRFVRVTIDLPDNIAFELIGSAFKVKYALKEDWDLLINQDLIPATKDARRAVMDTINITNEEVISKIMPIHPMAALVLKHISSAFKSNQRSMFDFIKNTDKETKSFQWFIENNGPEDDTPLLTVDMLWDFFYEKGRDNLAPEIRLILDVFPQQQNLRSDEQSVLKTILIMQAINRRLRGEIDLFKATERNLSYAYCGVSSMDGPRAGNIAKALKEKGILIATSVAGGQNIYEAAVLAGDQSKIDENKKEVRKNTTTKTLVTEGNLATVLSLTPALKLRYEKTPGVGDIETVTINDFTRVINVLRDSDVGWKFKSVIAFAKNDDEARLVRTMIEKAVADEQYKDIVFIDALSTPLGDESFEQYCDYCAMAKYYQGNNTSASRENERKAKGILEQDWKNRIYNGKYIVYTYENQQGEKIEKTEELKGKLQAIVTSKYQYVFDFEKGLTESQLKLTQAKQSALAGLNQATKGLIGGIEKATILPVWKVEKYWENESTKRLAISIIKNDIDAYIENSFDKSGQVSIGEIYDLLVNKYGFSLSNLSAFIAGFILKEYGGEPYRYADVDGGHDSMTAERLAEMIGNYMSKKAKTTYIVKMTSEERAFYDLSEKVWNIQENSCSSPIQVSNIVNANIKNLKLPVWCLEYVDDCGAYDILTRYIELIQEQDNKNVHAKAIELGKIYQNKPAIAQNLKSLITYENCQNGMRLFLKDYQEGKIVKIANAIGAQDNLLIDIAKLFAVKHSCLWKKSLGEELIETLYIEYSVIKNSNELLLTQCHTLNNTYSEWKNRLKAYGVSWEVLSQKFSVLNKAISILLKIAKTEDILPEQVKEFNQELIDKKSELSHLLNDRVVFGEVYAPYLEGLSQRECDEVRSKLPVDMFLSNSSECNVRVKQQVEDYKKNQLKTQLFNLWEEKTSTKSPIAWSAKNRIPILCCIGKEEFDNAKKVFDILNRRWAPEKEIKESIDFLKTAKFFEQINDEDKIVEMFKERFIGKYKTLLTEYKKVQDALDRYSIDVYDWYGNPTILDKIKQMAEAEYNAGGSQKAISKIDELDNANLKDYLKKIIETSMDIGVGILNIGD